MTPANDNQPAEQAGERILDHNRLQLSALMDGALSPDEARFLLRRLQHDEELAGCWTRWQLCGDVMRGRASMLVPADFSQRVARAIATDAAPARRGIGASSWARWGGGAALAASVAMMALFVARQTPDTPMTVQAPSRIVAAAPASASATAPVTATPAPDTATQLAAAMAVADVPRRVAARRSRGQSQRAAFRTSARGAESQVAIAGGTPVNAPAVAAGAVINPFAPNTTLPSRPWPRALLPNAPASGAFTVDYGSSAATSPSFYPFAPRLAAGVSAAATHADPAARDDGSQIP